MSFGRRRTRVDEHRAADPQAVRSGALALLGRREYASGEIAEALTRKGYAAAIVTEVVAELAAERLLDDSRYAEGLVRQLAGRGQGPGRIRQELQEAGISAALISQVLDSGHDWHALAREVRLRKFGATPPAGWPERARQMRFLQYRGFSNDHIGSCLDGDPGVPDSDA
ncbi:MAG: recombination regulator RecX [Pseudomonadota bacterium]|nr:recombination regulator RecX [Pseudomonadota bacterium]